MTSIRFRGGIKGMVEKLISLIPLLLGLGFFIGESPKSIAEDESPGLLAQKVQKLYAEGKYKEAIPIAEKVLAIRGKELSPEDPGIATSLNNLAELYQATGEYAKAEALFLQALRIRQKALGPDHPDTAQSLGNLAELYRDMGEYAKAEPLDLEALRIRQKVLGPEHPDTAISLSNLAALYQDQGEYAKAEPLDQEAIRILRQVLGPEHPDTATDLNNLASLYQDMGEYAKAEPLFQQALRIRQKALGPEHPATATSLDNLAGLYRAMGEPAKAEPLLQEALRIRQKILGPEHLDTAQSLNNLAELYRAMGEYAKAEPLDQEALNILQKVLGPEHPDIASSLYNLAGLYNDIGDYARAEPLLQQALQMRTKVLGPEHPDTARSLNSLAGLYLEMGDYAKAEPLLQQALQIMRKVFGSEHPETGRSLNNLAELNRVMGDYAKAGSLYQEALEVLQKVLGPEHPDTAASLNNLAGFYKQMGDYTKAEPLYKEALRIRTKVLGLEHADTALTLNNLAGLYEHMGDYTKAEPLYQQALRIVEKASGPDHPDTAAALENLAIVEFDLGKIDEAKSLARLSAKARLAILSKILSFTSEQQRLAYEDTVHPYSLFAVLKESETDLALALLRYKGVVLDSIIEDRLVAEASKESKDRDLVGRLATDKRLLGQLLLQSPSRPSAEPNNRIQNLEHEVEQFEGRLAQNVSGLGRARWALTVTVEQVQAVIPKDSVLVEYLRYLLYLGKGRLEQCYGAIVLGSTGRPRWIPLGKASGVDKLASRYQRVVRNASDQEELSANLEKLYQELWAPIEQATPSDTKRIIISPDGQLNFISFATLLDANKRFLAEKYTVQYTASGRDLLREVKPAPGAVAVIFANPDFRLASSQEVAQADNIASNSSADSMANTEKRGLEGSSFNRLEGTQKECDKLTGLFEAWHWQAESFTGKDASKEALLLVHSPYILHFATHGFFEAADERVSKLSDQQLDSFEPSMAKSKFFQNPMHRSGLVLAGANDTLKAWGRGETPPVENDGIVTAEDVAALDLKGTWLVSLSACDTGSGDAKAGEGVMGLRRGFIQAGAQNLLMTLWPISDETTIQIMRDFYEAAHTSGNAPQALAEVQRNWLVKLRTEQGLAQAVKLAGPFIMSSQGAP